MKITTVYEKFKGDESLFRCPICKEGVKFQNQASLVCENRHCFDLSKYGYINFLQKQIKTPYSKNLFESRRRIFADGFYDKLIDTLEDMIAKHTNDRPINMLDAGCGEGFFTTKISETDRFNGHVLAVDIEKDAVRMAAKLATNANCFVGDLANIPLLDQTVDVVLNIFSPANYEEFGRILATDGLVVKVVPNENYLQELRGHTKDQLSSKVYSNAQVLKLFEKHLDIIDRKSVAYTLPLSGSQLVDFMAMTPMMFHVDQDKVDLTSIQEMTIDVQVLVGRVRNA